MTCDLIISQTHTILSKLEGFWVDSEQVRYILEIKLIKLKEVTQ